MTTNYENENLTFYRGSTGYHEFILEVPETGLPFDLTGFEVRCQARLTADAEEVIFDVEIEDGGRNEFDKGHIFLYVDPSITRTMPNHCVYDILASSGSIVLPLAKGSINTLASVTRED